MVLHRAILALVYLSIVTACAPPTKVVVEERSVLTLRQESERIGGQLIRIVQPGDTLHGISFAANLDPNKVAAWNEISDTSKLRVGERVRLTEPIGFVPKTKAAKKPRTSKPRPRVVKKPTVVKPVVNKPAAVTPKRPAAQQKQVVTRTDSESWRWPITGPVIRGFSPRSNRQGIDIKSILGRSVKAARAGEVVYVGNSLRGYGNLIIVKHDETFLSAYAHNQTILVKEGQKVARHQTVGTVGSNDKRESALHFQIRHQGRPVNPLKYLPAK